MTFERTMTARLTGNTYSNVDANQEGSLPNDIPSATIFLHKNMNKYPVRFETMGLCQPRNQILPHQPTMILIVFH